MSTQDMELYNRTFDFSPQENGGESLTLLTRYKNNGYDEIYIDQEITLNSYCNTATFHLYGIAITPETLRECANALEEARMIAKEKLKELQKSEDG